MNRLAAILQPALVQVGVDATSKKRVFEQLGLLFENEQQLPRALITDSLFARERLGSTGLGHGVAIPHGRIKGLKNPLAAVLRVAAPIGFDAPDDEPVSLLIVLLVPDRLQSRITRTRPIKDDVRPRRVPQQPAGENQLLLVVVDEQNVDFDVSHDAGLSPLLEDRRFQTSRRQAPARRRPARRKSPVW